MRRGWPRGILDAQLAACGSEQCCGTVDLGGQVELPVAAHQGAHLLHRFHGQRPISSTSPAARVLSPARQRRRQLAFHRYRREPAPHHVVQVAAEPQAFLAGDAQAGPADLARSRRR